MNSRRPLSLFALALLALHVCALRSTAAQLAVSKDIVLLPASATITDGDLLTFNLQLRGDYASPSFVCHIDFGDGTPVIAWDHNPHVSHSYGYREGPPYQARAIIGIASRGGLVERAQSAFVPVTVRQKIPIRLALEADPTTAEIDQPITFKVRIVSGNATVAMNGYELSPGDDSAALISKSPDFVYAYPRADDYTARVKLRGTDFTAETRVKVQPWPTVSLQISGPPIKVGDPVSFEAVLDPPNTAWGYRFYLDDDSPPQFSAIPVVEHRYDSAGPRTVYVEAGPLGKTLVVSSVRATSEKKAIRVAERARLILRPGIVKAYEGDLIHFDVIFSDRSDVSGFVFDPGEKTVAALSSLPSRFTYQYQARGVYRARVSLRGQEAFAVVTILPSLHWVLWVLGTLALLGVVTGVAKAKGFFPFKPSVVFTVNRDAWPTTPWPGKKPPAIAFSVRWRGSRDVRKCKIETGHAQLIKTRRIHHD